jgi:serine/threonine-protein kinase
LEERSDPLPPRPVQAEAIVAKRRVPWSQMLPWALAGGASLVAAWLFHRGEPGPRGDPLSPVVARATIVLPADAPLAYPQDQPMGVTYPSIALSPDGSRLVYVAAVTKTSGIKMERGTQLYVRELHESSARPIPETVGGYFPFFSPDGRWVGYFADGKLFKVAIQGGAPVLLADAGKEINGADWSEDGTISFVDNPRLYRIPERGGVRELWESVADAAGASVFGHFVLPGSDNVLGAFYHRQSISGDFSPISVLSPSTNKKSVVVNRGYHARFVPPGFLVFARERGLHAAVFDPAALKLIGEPMAMVDGVLLNAVEKAAQYAVSRNGTLVYALGGLLHRATPAWLDRKGGLQKLPMEARTYGHMNISPDGSRFAILVPDVTQNIWVFDAATGRGGPLSEPGVQVSCVWTTDSSRLIIASERNGRCGLYAKNPNHASVPAETVYEFEDEKELLWPQSVAPDGKNLIGLRARGGVRVGFVLPLDGSRKLGKIVVPDDAWFLQFSPDGQWISFWSGKSGRGEVYVQRFPTGELVQVSFGGGEEARWSTKGDELYYRNGAVWMAVPVTTTPTFKAGESRTIFRGPYINVPGFSYDVSPDGQRFLVLQPEDSQEKPITELQVIFNWTEELKRKVPVGGGKGR